MIISRVLIGNVEEAEQSLTNNTEFIQTGYQSKVLQESSWNVNSSEWYNPEKRSNLIHMVKSQSQVLPYGVINLKYGLVPSEISS